MVKIKIIQANVGKGKFITDDLMQYVIKESVDLLAILEPYTYQNKVFGISNNYFKIAGDDKSRPKAALAIKKELKPIKIEEFTNEFIATAAIKANKHLIIMTSVYLNLVEENGEERNINRDLSIVQNLIDKYSDQLKYKLVIFTDSNCRCSLWGDHFEQVRDRENIFLDFIDSNDMIIHNDSSQGPTYMKYVKRDEEIIEYKSYIDLTITNRLSENSIHSRRLMSVVKTEHRQILIELNTTSTINKESTLTYKLFNINKIDWNAFVIAYRENRPGLNLINFSKANLERLAEAYTDAVIRALKKSTPKIKRKSTDQPWFNERLREMKRAIDNILKKIKRNVGKPNKVYLLDDLKQFNKNYRKMLKEEKRNYYNKINDINTTNDLWRLLKKARSIKGDSFKEYTLSNNKQSVDRDEIEKEKYLFDISK